MQVQYDLFKVLQPTQGHSNLLAATIPVDVVLDDPTHPCHGLFRVIKGELTKPVTPAEVIPWTPVLTKVAVTYHHTLSKAFCQRLQPLADPSRAALRTVAWSSAGPCRSASRPTSPACPPSSPL